MLYFLAFSTNPCRKSMNLQQWIVNFWFGLSTNEVDKFELICFLLIQRFTNWMIGLNQNTFRGRKHCVASSDYLEVWDNGPSIPKRNDNKTFHWHFSFSKDWKGVNVMAYWNVKSKFSCFNLLIWMMTWHFTILKVKIVPNLTETRSARNMEKKTI